MSIEAMKQALEALDIGLEYAESELYENQRRYEGYMHLAPDDQAYVNQIKEAITSLRQAIEQAEKQEPVIGTKTWYEDGKVITQNLYPSDVYKQEKQEPVAWNSGVPPLYPQIKDGETISVEYLETTPQPQREWVGLTDGDVFQIAEQCGLASVDWIDVMRAVEAKLKEKNT